MSSIVWLAGLKPTIEIAKITKNLAPKNKNERYQIKNSKDQIIKKSEGLDSLIEKTVWKKLKLVN